MTSDQVGDATLTDPRPPAVSDAVRAEHGAMWACGCLGCETALRDRYGA
jgi:hypothetical protein